MYEFRGLALRTASVQTVADLGPALDKWDALGTELGRTVEDDFRLIALREIVPKAMADNLLTQASLSQFPQALQYVRAQVASHRHTMQHRTTPGGYDLPTHPQNTKAILLQTS